MTLDAARKIDVGGARRDLADQVLRRPSDQRGDRPGGAGARRPRPDRPHTAGDDADPRPRRPDSTWSCPSPTLLMPTRR